ncbi:hypothetical protein C9374_003496 [Naegleria lovaniensis]|uniref:Uncharacterized protein n=1 Tax=Naegleria lovaniensis TaxID=51637 RepID=A0AA88GP22_NAELO|nr:uncharacterized protein C9374_003496 [Naegleria lovaniensis]KAG2385681.1 hypothetical protein C9374_003496 [Naegleria lovaniensis]
MMSFGTLHRGMRMDESTFFDDDEPVVVVESGDQDLISQHQHPASLVLYLKDSRNRDFVVKRQMIQDLIMVDDFEGLMKRIALLFETSNTSSINQMFHHNSDNRPTLSSSNDLMMKIEYRVGSSKKLPLTKDYEWREALQRLLQSNCTCMELFVKLKSKQKIKGSSASPSLVRRVIVPRFQSGSDTLLSSRVLYQKKRPKSLFKLMDRDVSRSFASCFNRIIIDASSMILAVKELKFLFLHKNRKEQAERFIIQMCSHLHHVHSLKLMHICFNSTSNLVIPENQRDDTFVVSVAPAFSFVNEQVVESANRQIIAGYLESCLVITNDCVLTKEMKNMGVKCCSPKSFLKQNFKVFSRLNKEMKNMNKKNAFREWITSHIDIPMFN